MKYNELEVKASRASNRVGRGIAAGKGKTAGRGTKGQNSRSGARKKPGFEGGQNPLMQRLPKLHGFRSPKPSPEVVYTGQLDKLNSGTVDANSLASAGFISSPYVSVKLIVKGDVSKKHTVKLTAASASAIRAVEKAGGTFAHSSRLSRQPKKQAKADSVNAKVS